MLVVLLILVVIVGGGIYWLNRSAQAAVNVASILTVYQPAASVQPNGGSYAAATTGARVQAGDSLKTDTKGRASIQLPDGTLTRLASDSEITLDAAHFTQSGNLSDARITQKIGRTLCLNPGSDYASGTLQAVVVTLDLKKRRAKSHQFVSG